MMIRDALTGKTKRYDLIYPIHFIQLVNIETELAEECLMMSIDAENWNGKAGTVIIKVFPVFSMRYTAREFWKKMSDEAKNKITESGRMARFSLIPNKSIFEALTVGCIRCGAEAVTVDSGQKSQMVIQPNMKNAEVVMTKDGESTTFRLDQLKEKGGDDG